MRSDSVRADYEAKASKLDPNDSVGRRALKDATRSKTPAEVRSIVEAKRPGVGPKPGSGGRANVTNAKVNQVARNLGKVGKGAGVVGLGAAAIDIAPSENPGRAAAANGGAKD